MIRRLKYHEIDFGKYSLCVQHSLQNNFYAQRRILDFLTKNSWELLVKDDYEAVMPVPVTKKWGVKLVFMPLFCQQLGIYSPEDNRELNEEFFKALIKKYRVVNYQFNEHNEFRQDFKVRKNYVVPIAEYAVLRKSYFKGRKSTVKTAQYLHYKETRNLEDNLDFIKTHVKGLHKDKDIDKLLNYLNFLSKNEKLLLTQAFKEENLISCALWIEEKEQNSLIALINDSHYKKDNGASFVIDAFLQRYSNVKKTNFMGGSIRGIEVFFKSFGSQLHSYPIFTHPFWLRLIR